MPMVFGEWSWEELGGGSAPGDAVGACGAAVDVSGAMHVAASEAFVSHDFHYFRLDGAVRTRHRFRSPDESQGWGSADVAVGANGQAHLVYCPWRSDAPNSLAGEILYVVHDGTRPQRQERVAGERALQAAIALDAAGAPIVVFYAAAPLRRMCLARWTAQGFVTETVATAPVGSGLFPSVRRDAAGALHVAHFANHGVRPWYSRRSADGMTWLHEEVDGADTGGYWPSLALGPGGVPLVSYTCTRAKQQDPHPVRLATRVADKSWTRETLPVGSAQGVTSCAVDASGRVHVLVQEHGSRDLVMCVREKKGWQVERTLPGFGREGMARLILDAGDVPRVAVVHAAEATWSTHVVVGRRSAPYGVRPAHDKHGGGEGTPAEPWWRSPNASGGFDV